jgi:hypothetical protein
MQFHIITFVSQTSLRDIDMKRFHSIFSPQSNCFLVKRVRSWTCHSSQPVPIHRTASQLIIMSKPADKSFYSRQNIFNICLLHTVAVPIVFLGFHVLFDCSPSKFNPITSPLLDSLISTPNVMDLTCRVGLHHPLVFVNIIMFFFVCVVFWLISLYQKSTWLIGKSSPMIILSMQLNNQK